MPRLDVLFGQHMQYWMIQPRLTRGSPCSEAAYGYAGSGWTYFTRRSRSMMDCDGHAVTPNDDRAARMSTPVRFDPAIAESAYLTLVVCRRVEGAVPRRPDGLHWHRVSHSVRDRAVVHAQRSEPIRSGANVKYALSFSQPRCTNPAEIATRAALIPPTWVVSSSGTVNRVKLPRCGRVPLLNPATTLGRRGFSRVFQ